MIIMGGVVFPGFTQCCMMIIMGGVVFPGFTPQGQVHEVALRFLIIGKEKYFMMMHTYCVRMSSAWGTTHPPENS